MLSAVILSERSYPAMHLADRKSTRLNSSHVRISYAVFCLKKKTTCLALFGYSEARGEGYAGMAAVIATVLARLASSLWLRTDCELAEALAHSLCIDCCTYP